MLTLGLPTWSRDCFKILPFVVMQRIARICPRKLSYLYYVAVIAAAAAAPRVLVPFFLSFINAFIHSFI